MRAGLADRTGPQNVMPEMICSAQPQQNQKRGLGHGGWRPAAAVAHRTTTFLMAFVSEMAAATERAVMTTCCAAAARRSSRMCSAALWGASTSRTSDATCAAALDRHHRHTAAARTRQRQAPHTTARLKDLPLALHTGRCRRHDLTEDGAGRLAVAAAEGPT